MDQDDIDIWLLVSRMTFWAFFSILLGAVAGYFLAGIDADILILYVYFAAQTLFWGHFSLLFGG